MSVEIKLLTAADAALFDRIAEEVFDEPIHPQRLKAYLAEPGHLMVVALADGEMIGQVAAIIHRHPDKPTELYIDEVGVTPAWQRRGVAQQMLEAMFAHGKALGCEEAWVGTEPDNLPARRLYERHCYGPAETFVMYVCSL